MNKCKREEKEKLRKTGEKKKAFEYFQATN